jgi:hypothetical protein
MAKKKAAKPETKSDFLRRILGRNPNLDYRQVNQRWRKAGHPGEISNPLYYLIRRELGIQTVWTWVKEPPAATREVYQFKVRLLETQPPIWRRIQIRDSTLDKLHEHIQTAMGWTNSHLHHFRIDDTLYGDPMLLMPENLREMGYRDSTMTLLSHNLPRDDGPFSFEYEYDFGDGWLHEVRFEGRPPAEPGKRYPICLEGQRACPPDDVGGVWGYADFLVAIADPDHEEHDELLEWAGGTFDPEAFDPTEATRRMKRGLPDWRSMR